MLFLVVNSLFAQVYKWIDDQGIAHFSDYPYQAAESIKLSAVQYCSLPLLYEIKKIDPRQEFSSYQIVIIQPTDEATIRNNQGRLTIIVRITPKLRTKDKLQLILDNSENQKQKESTFLLKGIERGKHQFIVKIVDEQGGALSTSKPITFFMHRPYVNRYRHNVKFH